MPLKLKKNITPMELFLMVSGFGILGFFVAIVPQYGTESFQWLVIEHNWNFQFADYYRPVIIAKDLSEVYTNGVNIPYPPLSFLIFHLLWRLGPNDVEILWQEWQRYEGYQYNLLTLLMLTIITAVLMAMLIKKLLSDYKDSQVCIFSLLILFSAPFYQGVIERGNMVFMCLVLLLFFAYFKDSENKVMRELSLIFIAIAVGIKIYPAVFGILYLKERRWNEVCRLIVYGMIFFFLPFLFTGGIEGFLGFLDRLEWVNKKGTSTRMWTSIQCFLNAACDYLGLKWNTRLVGKIMELLFAVVLMIMALVDHKRWKSILYLCGIMTVCTARTFRYNAIFMLIPLLIFLAENKSRTENQKIDYLYAFLFATSFTIPIWGIKREADFFIFFPFYLILLISILETTACFVTERRLLFTERKKKK